MSADLRTLTPGQPVEIGPFRVHPIRVAHSVLDSLALAIETPAGVVLATGDFKIDAAAPPEERTDLEALSRLGRARRAGAALRQHQRRAARPHGRRGRRAARVRASIFARTRGRVARLLLRDLDPAHPARRRHGAPATAGRSASWAGAWSTTPRWRSTSACCASLGRSRCSGQRGGRAAARAPGAVRVRQPGRAVVRALAGERRRAPRASPSGPGDTVVLSARAIPGNERAVSRVIGNLFRRGCDVVHGGTAHVHVSGHGQPGRPGRAAGARAPALPGARARRVPDARAARAPGRAQPGCPPTACCWPRTATCWRSDADGARKEGRVSAGRMLLDRSGIDGRRGGRDPRPPPPLRRGHRGAGDRARQADGPAASRRPRS